MSNWKENQEIEIKENNKFKLDATMLIAIGIFIIAISFAFNAYTKHQEQKEMQRLMKSYTNMMGSAGLNMIDAQEKIKKNFEQLKNYQ